MSSTVSTMAIASIAAGPAARAAEPVGGSHWGPAHQISDQTTSAGPALTELDGLLYLAYKARDNSDTIYSTVSS